MTRLPTPRSPIRAALLLTGFLGAACGEEPAPRPEAQAQAPNPLLTPRRLTATAPPSYRVRLTTSAGDVVLEVHRDWAPLGADRFYNLVRNGFYDDTRVYRVLEGFLAQFGLNGDPRVNMAWKDAILVDDPRVASNARGRVAFAKSGPNSRTTTVFISLRDNAALDEEGFVPFGEVVEGMDVVASFHAGYGDGPPRAQGPYPAQIQAQGNAYLDVSFPDLTRIVSARIELEADAP